MISQLCTTMDWLLDQHSWKQSQLYTLRRKGSVSATYLEPGSIQNPF